MWTTGKLYGSSKLKILPETRVHINFASLNRKINEKELSLCNKLKFSNPYIFEPDSVEHRYFKLRWFDVTEFTD